MSSHSHRPPIVKAVIPAAGLGTRLRPLTRATPKELLPVGRKPVLAHVVAELRRAGITQALFIVSERKPQIRDYFGSLYDEESASTVQDTLPPLQCDYVIQEEQRGSGDAVLCAEEWVDGEPFVVAFGDCLIEGGVEGGDPLRRMVETHHAHGAAATILVERVAREKVFRYGVVAPEGEVGDAPTEPFPLRDLVEKPAPEAAPSNLVVAARFTLDNSIFDALHRTGLDVRGEQNLPDAIRLLRQEGNPIYAVPLREGEARRDIGNFETYFAAFLRAALRDPELGAATRRIISE